MTDYFALLELPRRPGLDEEALKENYLRLAAAWHPDAVGGDVEKFRELQEARKVLLNPAARLRHLLALEGSAAGGNFPPSSELFLEVAGALDGAKKITAGFQAARSSIARAGLAGSRVVAERQVARAAETVAGHTAACLARIAEMDAAWPEKNFPALEEIRARLVYLARWDAALQEALFGVQNPPGV